MRIDLHTHSNVSDGSDSPTRLLLEAQRRQMDLIALTDHDTFGGVREAVEAGRRVGVKVLPGIEITASHRTGTVHLLGYGCRIDDEPLNEALTKLIVERKERVPRILHRLAELGMELSPSDVAAHSTRAVSPGRPHVADAMVAKGYVQDRGEAFDRFLGSGKPAYVPHAGIPVADGVDLIHLAGGAAVIAHPLIQDRGNNISSEEVQMLVAEHQLDGIEVDHPDHDQHSRDLLQTFGARLGLIRTGSSDYHGTGKVGHEIGCELTRETAMRDLIRLIHGRGGVAPAL